jgi:hypothetical protein
VRQIFRAIETTIGLTEAEKVSCINITALDPIGSEASKPGSKIASVNRSEGASQERVND